MDPEAPEGEEVEALSEAQRVADPLWQVRIKNNVGGRVFTGRVVGIDEGAISKDRLYLVQYEDGDLEHMTAETVRSCAEKPVAASPRPSPGRRSKAAASPSPPKSAMKVGRKPKEPEPEEDEAEEDEDEEEEESKPKAMKKGRPSGGAKAMKEMKVKKDVKVKAMKAEKVMKAAKDKKVAM